MKLTIRKVPAKHRLDMIDNYRLSRNAEVLYSIPDDRLEFDLSSIDVSSIDSLSLRFIRWQLSQAFLKVAEIKQQPYSTTFEYTDVLYFDLMIPLSDALPFDEFERLAQHIAQEAPQTPERFGEPIFILQRETKQARHILLVVSVLDFKEGISNRKKLLEEPIHYVEWFNRQCESLNLTLRLTSEECVIENSTRYSSYSQEGNYDDGDA